MTPDDELRAIAEAVFPEDAANWHTEDDEEGRCYIRIPRGHDICYGDLETTDPCCHRIAAFIATFDPPTVKGLLDRIAGLEAELAEYRSVESARDAGWSVIQLRDGSKK